MNCYNCQSTKQVVYLNLQHPSSPEGSKLTYTPRMYCWDCLDAILNQYWHQLAANLRPPREKAGAA